MTIYYDEDNGNLLTQDEAYDVAKTIVELNESHLEALERLSPLEIWDLLSEENKIKIMDKEIEIVLDYFVQRDFDIEDLIHER